MRQFNARVFTTGGSNDEVHMEMTGWEWLRIIRIMKKKWIFIFGLICNTFAFMGPYVFSTIQGKLATILIEGQFETAEDFINATNKMTNIMIAAALTLFTMHLSACIAESFKSPQYLRELRTEVFKSFMSFELGYFDVTQTGIILSRLQDDTINAFEAYTVKLVNLCRVTFNWCLGLGLCLHINIKITIVLLLCLPFFALSHVLGSKAINRIWREYSESNEEVSAKAEEVLSFRTVRSFDAELREYKNYKNKLKAVHNVEVRASHIHGAKECISNITFWITASLVLYLCGIKAVNGEIESGAIINIVFMIQAWSNSFADIFSLLTNFQQSNISASKLKTIIERKSKIPLHVGDKIGNVRGRIEFRNVTFTYEDRDIPAVDDLSFVINPGETVAIVGESGCGKSTTLLLLQRFYDPQRGQVLIDDNDIKRIDPISLRSQIAIVPQNPVMFSMTVKENIKYGKLDANREQVIQAAEIANAHNFIRQMAQGYKTEVEQNSLSGGQKQRICIARAIMVGAPILLLDEATAALDTESERLVQDALQNYRHGKTAIVVAHRLATVRNADRILVMDKGKIVETGTHDELIEKSGFYAHLVQHQLQ